MKTIIQLILLLTVSLILINCSSDDEIPVPGPVYTDTPDKYIPVEPLADSSALEISGFPKIIKKYHNDDLYDWAQYFYRPDGNLLKINHSYPQSGPGIFTDTYQYDNDGNLIGLNGHYEYQFYWDKGHIVKADTYNGAWYGRIKIFYEYNTEEQIIQKIEDYIDFSFSDKTTYSYFEDGNLKTIEYYYKDGENEVFKLYSVTSFDEYNEDRNLFLELEIIPGQIVQHQFPASMNVVNVTDSNYDSYETYDYKYDSEGRVIEKTFGSNSVVYEYY